MTKELLQQALDALTRLSFLGNGDYPGNSEGNVIAQKAVSDIKQALAQQEQCGCREGECETKKDKTCRMTIEIAERDGIPEWTPAIGIECAISNLRDDAARLRDGSYTPLQIADDLDVIANDLGKCKSLTQQEQPASVDAYVGAREDAAIWKKRALEAEELNRKFIAELNGPTYLGEPAQQEQPVIEQSILDYTKGIYDYLQSTAPAGTADEAFRLPPTPSRNQRQIQDFAQGHSLGLVLQATGQDCGNGEQTGEHVEQPATPEDMKIYKDIADGYRRDVAQQEQPSDSEYARGFADGQKEFAEIAGGAWQTAVTDQLVIHHIYQAVHDTDPRKAVHDLLYISNDIALDPQVSSDAQALVDRGRREAQQEQPANRVYFVATGEVYDGQETYTRHDTPPPLSEFEILFSTAQPAQEPVAAHPIGFDYLDSGQLVATYALPVEGKNHPKLYTHPAPTQPALTYADLEACREVAANTFRRHKSSVRGQQLSEWDDHEWHLAKAIEDHCRGGQA